jgi:hypothetical protein
MQSTAIDLRCRRFAPIVLTECAAPIKNADHDDRKTQVPRASPCALSSAGTRSHRRPSRGCRAYALHGGIVEHDHWVLAAKLECTRFSVDGPWAMTRLPGRRLADESN